MLSYSGRMVVWWLAGWTANHEVRGSNPRPGEKFGSRFLYHLHLLANAAMMSTLTTHCQWEDETVREMTGHLPSNAVAKKMKSLTPIISIFPVTVLHTAAPLQSVLVLIKMVYFV